jgi:hypothetical protein
MAEDKSILKVTEDAKEVAGDLVARGYMWTDEYSESFAEYVDRLAHFNDRRPKYLAGAKIILEICSKAGDRDSVWEELGLDPEEKAKIKYCCVKIVEITKNEVLA